jgi:glucan phosphoethanolaminetransferase (alkaline phosphatase superfamily)
MDANNMYQYLGKDDIILNIAMVLGFVQVLRCSNFVYSPLSVLCWAIIVAIIYSFIAKLIVYITPQLLKPLFSIILLMSLVYYVGFKQSCYDDRIKVEVKKCNVNDKENTIIIKPFCDGTNDL